MSTPPILCLGRGRSATSIARFFGQAQALEETEDSVTLWNWTAGEWIQKERFAGGFEQISWEDFLPAKVFLSPGIDPRREFFSSVQAVEERELELFCNQFGGQIIGITGTNGKSSFTAALGGLLKEACGEEKVFVGGNLGTPLFEALQRGVAYELAVVELSSFQLERIEGLSMNLGILLNLSPDHLDRYDSIEDYYQTKWGLLKNAQSIIYPKDYRPPSGLAASAVDFWALEPFQDVLKRVGGFLESRLSLKIPAGAWSRIQSLPHRLERWQSERGVIFVNDSKSTNIASTRYALASRPKIRGRSYLILGGRDKGGDFSELAADLSGIEQVFVYGECREKICKALSASVKTEVFSSLGDLMKSVPSRLQEDDLLLLSPACSSFDEFKNYEDRGDRFFQWAKEAESSLIARAKTR
ncbi:MAG: hypothetical protein EA369_04430 [Bradymonadales bacterium]|nr:MAG: hypothetical protein EA369_04430 [Bradymonadales bacterium]